MRIETGTFELRDNDMMMRELTFAETNEVAGGVSQATVVAQATSVAGTLTTSGGAFALTTTALTASAAIATNFAATGAGNVLALQATALTQP